jgi:hypothetical protein
VQRKLRHIPLIAVKGKGLCTFSHDYRVIDTMYYNNVAISIIVLCLFSEAKSVATQYDCKFAETSATLNHHIDELLVGILSQIRLKSKPHASTPDTCSAAAPRRKPDKKRSSKGPRGLLSRLFGKHKKKACDNLYT